MSGQRTLRIDHQASSSSIIENMQEPDNEYELQKNKDFSLKEIDNHLSIDEVPD